MRKVTRTKKTILKRDGVVTLVKLSRTDCAQENYGCSFPQKIGKDENGNVIEGGIICEQFHSEAEALRAFHRYAEFFNAHRYPANHHT